MKANFAATLDFKNYGLQKQSQEDSSQISGKLAI